MSFLDRVLDFIFPSRWKREVEEKSRKALVDTIKRDLNNHTVAAPKAIATGSQPTRMSEARKLTQGLVAWFDKGKQPTVNIAVPLGPPAPPPTGLPAGCQRDGLVKGEDGIWREREPRGSGQDNPTVYDITLNPGGVNTNPPPTTRPPVGYITINEARRRAGLAAVQGDEGMQGYNTDVDALNVMGRNPQRGRPIAPKPPRKKEPRVAFRKMRVMTR